jgi:CubicO group peptidase (beta-lactamase class C family)
MGMTESDLVANETNIHLIGIGHASDMPQLWDLERDSWIAGSMLSTTSDLAKYMTGLMNQKGLSIKTYDEMFAPQVENTTPFHQFFGGTKVFHSLGFEVQKTENGRIYHHGGNNGDYQGRWAMDLNRMCGYVVLTNSNAGFYFDQVLQQFLVTGK